MGRGRRVYILEWELGATVGIISGKIALALETISSSGTYFPGSREN